MSRKSVVRWRHVFLNDLTDYESGNTSARHTSTCRLKCCERSNTPSVFSSDLEVGKLKSQTKDCGVYITLRNADRFGKPKVRKYP